MTSDLVDRSEESDDNDLDKIYCDEDNNETDHEWKDKDKTFT